MAASGALVAYWVAVASCRGGRAEKYCDQATQNCTNRHAASCPAVPSPLPIINWRARASKNSPGPLQTIGSHLEKPPNPCCTRFAHNSGLRYRFPNAPCCHIAYFSFYSTFLCNLECPSRASSNPSSRVSNLKVAVHTKPVPRAIHDVSPAFRRRFL
jgi:hypothetical protein